MGGAMPTVAQLRQIEDLFRAGYAPKKIGEITGMSKQRAEYYLKTSAVWRGYRRLLAEGNEYAVAWSGHLARRHGQLLAVFLALGAVPTSAAVWGLT